MCGRFTLTKNDTDLIDFLEIENLESDLTWNPNYNIAPTLETPILIFNGKRSVQSMRWGLAPYWATDRNIGRRMINARSETINEKVTYCNLIHSQRCIVIADGYYEWMQRAEKKQPYYIYCSKMKILPLAGLWDMWLDSSGNAWKTYTIITSEPVDSIKHIHKRMPVILNISSIDTWINSDFASKEAMALLKPFASTLDYYPVSALVNSPYNNELNCIEPVNMDKL